LHPESLHILLRNSPEREKGLEMRHAQLWMAGMLLCASNLCLHGQKTMDPADIANLKQVSDPQVSPDGKNVAYVVTSPVGPDKHKDAHIWLASTAEAGKACLFVFSSGTDTTPRWSPDGTSLAFLSDRRNPLSEEKDSSFHFSIAGAENRDDLTRKDKQKTDENADQEMQLWIISLRGGEATPLTDITGGVKSFQWSRDGKSIAFVRRDQDTKAEQEKKKQKHDEVLVDQNYKYDRLWIYDLAKREARLITKTDINIDAFDWSSNGLQLIARVSPTPRMDDYWRVSKIVLLDAETGAVQKTLEEHAGYMSPRWSRDGHRVVFSKETAKRITDMHVIYDLDSGKEIVVEDKYPGTVEQLIWAPDNKDVLGEAIEGAHSLTIRVDAVSGVVSTVKGIDAPVGSITISDDGKLFTYLGASMQQPDEIWAHTGEHTQVLTDTNPQAAGWKLGTEREIQWKNSKDGRTIHGVLVLPPDYQEGKRYKTVVHIHGGPEEAWTTGWHGSWYNYAAMLSSHGYVVLLPNPRGSDGGGPQLAEANFQDWGGGDFQDIMDGVDYLIAQGITDPERLAVGGWSFGGFMTAWTVTHTNRFKAAMVGAGVTDIYSMATTTDIAPSFQDGYFGTFATSRQLYDAHSSVRYLDQCHTPVLVLHGEADPRVPISQGEEFYYGLRFLGRETVMVRYPREPHIFTEREHQIDSLGRILAWYDSHLR
jgi:dipeptidyl aminopeptidase/acylaminoacyl peptidase